MTRRNGQHAFNTELTFYVRNHIRILEKKYGYGRAIKILAERIDYPKEQIERVVNTKRRKSYLTN